MTTIVTGFGRCGSTMVMRMLDAAGMPVVADSRASFESDLFSQPRLMDWNQFAGRAIKVLDPHRWCFPAASNVRFLFLARFPIDQARSHGKLLRAMCGVPVSRQQVAGIAKSLVDDYDRFRFHLQPHPFLVLRFEHILFKPAREAARIGAFLGEGFSTPEAIERMAGVVERRKPACRPDMSYEVGLVEAESRGQCPEVRGLAEGGEGMRGTELTVEQIASAREFVHGRTRNVKTMPKDEQAVSMTFGQLARLVAWYGAIRYDAGAHGRGKLAVPAEMVVRG